MRLHSSRVECSLPGALEERSASCNSPGPTLGFVQGTGPAECQPLHLAFRHVDGAVRSSPNLKGQQQLSELLTRGSELTLSLISLG